jgi:hypothetical protein
LDNKSNYDHELKKLVNELAIVKDQLKDLKKKYQQEELSHSETKDKLIAMKKENDEIKKFINNKLSSQISLNNSSRSNTLKSNDNIKEEEKNSSMNMTDEKIKHIDNNNNNNNTEEKKELTDDKNNHSFNYKLSNIRNSSMKPNKNNQSNNQKLLSLNKSQPKLKNNTKVNYKESEYDKLFTTEELSKLEKVVSKEDLDRFIKKYDTLLHSKLSLESKSKVELKKYSLIGSENNEKLEYFTLQLKESEQKAKIYSYQINEYKNEVKILLRKHNEMSQALEVNKHNLQEKEQENKILVGQLQQLRKLTKHNALAPLDYDVSKKVELIKNEELNSSLISNNNDLSMSKNLSDTKDLKLIDLNTIGLEFDIFTYCEKVGRKVALRQVALSCFSYKGINSMLKESYFDNYIEEVRAGYSSQFSYYHNVSSFLNNFFKGFACM